MFVMAMGIACTLKLAPIPAGAGAPQPATLARAPSEAAPVAVPLPPPVPARSEPILTADLGAGPERWVVESRDLPVRDADGGAWFPSLELRVLRDGVVVAELPVAGTLDQLAGRGSVLAPTLEAVGGTTFVRVAVYDAQWGGSESDHAVLYAFLDGEIRDVAHLPIDWVLRADEGGWRELLVEDEDVRLVFDGRRYRREVLVEDQEPAEDEGAEEQIVFQSCGQWECCVDGDVLVEDTQLFSAFDADVPTIDLPAGAVIEALEFWWVFDDLVEAEVLSNEACDRMLSDEDFEWEDSDLVQVYILGYTEENGVSLWWPSGAWSQTSADCVVDGAVSGSTTWVEVTAGGVHGYLPLSDLRVEEPESPDPSDWFCRFGQRSLY